MKRTLTFGTAALVLAAVATASYQAITLAPTLKEGDVTKYSLKADITVAGMEAAFTGKVTEKVLKVEADGTYTVESTNSEGKVSLGGQEMEMPGGEPSVAVYKKGGELKELRGNGADPNAYRMAGMTGFRYPDKAVNVGDEWKITWTKSDKGAVAGEATFKVDSMDKVGNWDSVKIKMSAKETEGETPASAEGFVWISKTDGRMTKMEATWKNAPFPGAPGPIDAKVVMTRVE